LKETCAGLFHYITFTKRSDFMAKRVPKKIIIMALGIGVAIGAGLGVVFNSVVIGVTIGLGVGLAFLFGHTMRG